MHFNDSRVMKVIVVGSVGCGKSALVRSFIKGIHYREPKGIYDYATERFILNEQPIQMQVHDPTGTSKNVIYHRDIYRFMEGVMILCDVTNPGSLGEIRCWLFDIKVSVDLRPIDVLLVGTKTDLKDQRVVSSTQLLECGRKFNIKVWETSAETGLGVRSAFMALAADVLSPKTIPFRLKE